MIDNVKRNSTNSSYSDLMTYHQGGGFVVNPRGIIDTSLDETAIASVPGLKQFSISIYNQQTDSDVISLIFMVNPSDVTFGQTTVSGDSYAREGWVSTLWGRGQPTILANGSTAAFYIGGSGLTALSRRSSLSFRNFISILAIFKNNGYYFLSGPENKDLFDAVGVNKGRVISVMDLIKISYDDGDYIGSFNSFTIDETAEAPFRFNFNFEFIISGLRGEPVSGHLKMCGPTGCNTVKSIIVQTAGSYTYDETVSLDTTQQDIVFQKPVASDTIGTSWNVGNGSNLGTSPVKGYKGNLNKLSNNVNTYNDLITNAISNYGTSVPSNLVKAIMMWESGGNPNAVNPNKNTYGVVTSTDYGLMQVNSKNINNFSTSIGRPLNPLDPKDNIDGAVSYINTLWTKYNGDVNKIVAAYNAGPTSVDNAINYPNSHSIPASTANVYVPNVLNNYNYLNKVDTSKVTQQTT
jgi:Transglycosylase SLT domain